MIPTTRTIEATPSRRDVPVIPAIKGIDSAVQDAAIVEHDQLPEK